MSKFPIEVKKSDYGRGVFATQFIKKGSLVEVCPVIPLSSRESRHVAETALDSYIFEWIGPRQPLTTPVEKWTGVCMALGYGALYNHSFTPNMRWRHALKDKSLRFYAIRNIELGEELTHSYNWDHVKYTQTGIAVPKDYVF